MCHPVGDGCLLRAPRCPQEAVERLVNRWCGVPEGQKTAGWPVEGVVGTLPSTRKPRKGRASTWPRSRASPQSRLQGNSTRAAGRLLLRLSRPVASHCPGPGLGAWASGFQGLNRCTWCDFSRGRDPSGGTPPLCERPPGRVVSACLASSGPLPNHSVMPESSEISSVGMFCHWTSQ